MLLTTLIISLQFFQHTWSADTCRTLNGGNGECKPVHECMEVYSLFQNGLSPATATLIRQLRCGPRSGYPNVCCSTLLPDKSECGLSTQNRIYGGNGTDLDELPWTALLEYRAQNGQIGLGCGGSLISKRYVLTARHCLLKSLVKVRLGEWDTRSDPDCIRNQNGKLECAPKTLRIPVEKMIPFEGDGDIGLIRLINDVTFNDFVRPICLPSKSDTNSYLGESLVVAGWGATAKKAFNEVKLKVKMTVQPSVLCEQGLKKAFMEDVLLNENQICAGGKKGEDTCNGDSGGPLMYRNSERVEIIGIVSFGPTPCGQENTPGVYVRVSKYIDWIINNTKP